MTDGMRRRLRRLRARANAAKVVERGSEPPALVSLAPSDPVSAVAELLDIGASRVGSGIRHSHDLAVDDLPTLLASATRHAEQRGQRVFMQLAGRCLPLTIRLLQRRLGEIGSRPRLRLLVVNRDDRIAGNIAVDLWKEARRGYRSLSDEDDVRLFIPDGQPPPAEPTVTESGFADPVDVVYTWVDSADPAWRALAADHLDLEALEHDLYTSGDELRYSMRSVDVFAPWVRRVHVLSNCSPPAWFEASDRFRWVDHREVAEPGMLPLFNSGAIDTLLHRVPGLAEHFLYLNDDFLLWDSVTPADFFEWDGRTIARLAMNSSVLYLQQLVDAGQATPSQHSRVNAGHVLQQRVGVFQTRVHGHVPYALRRSAMVGLERDFPEEIERTRASRTRQPGDVSFIAYLYHHYGHASGNVSYSAAPRSFVTLQNYQRRAIARALRTAPFVCFQDSRGSATDADYQAFKRGALEHALPLPSGAESIG